LPVTWLRFAIHFDQYVPISAFDQGTAVGSDGTVWFAVALSGRGSHVLVVTCDAQDASPRGSPDAPDASVEK
jgi:hypothetical protein